MQRRINERPVSEKLSDGDVYTLSIVATMWCRDNVAAETPLTTTMAPTVFHVGAIQDHQAGYLRRAFRSLMSPITALDLGQDVAITRHRGDHILRKIGSWPTRACASRRGVDAPLPQDGGQDNHEIAISKSRAATSQCAMNVSIASQLRQISMAGSRACRRSSVGAFGSPSSNMHSAARPKESVSSLV